MRPLPVIMEPSPWEQNDEPDSGSNLLIDGQTAQISTGFGNQVIMLQQPSSAAKVIGILLIIWGGLNAVFLLLAILGWSDAEARTGYRFTEYRSECGLRNNFHSDINNWGYLDDELSAQRGIPRAHRNFNWIFVLHSSKFYWFYRCRCTRYWIK